MKKPGYFKTLIIILLTFLLVFGGGFDAFFLLSRSAVAEDQVNPDSEIVDERGTLYSFGSLGMGLDEPRYDVGNIPFETESFSGVKMVSAGREHSLVLLENGTVYSFGRGRYGRLGHGSDTDDKYFPTKIEFNFPDTVISVSAGGDHSLVLLKNGDVYSFGYNSSGQLAMPDYSMRHTPEKITSLPGKAIDISAGDRHSLVLLENGDVFSFGRNCSGQLGAGEISIRARDPRRVDSFPDNVSIKSVSAGKDFSLVLTEDGDVYSFGSNNYGKLGLGHTFDRHEPEKIEEYFKYGNPVEVNVTLISTGEDHSLLLDDNGEVYSFGYGDSGRLGHSTPMSTERSPRFVTRLESNIKSVSAGGAHSLALREDGVVHSFGSNSFGQLGIDDRDLSAIPVKVNVSESKGISAGRYHSFVLQENFQVYSFGRGVNGRLGLGDTDSRDTPVRVKGFENIKEVSSGESHSLVLLEDGSVYSFGYNYYGQLGVGDWGDRRNRHVPTKIEGFENVISVSAGGSHSLILLASGEVYSFGRGLHGRLGHGADTGDRFSPRKIEGVETAVAISAGRNHSLILHGDGTVESFGLGTHGRLGHGDNSNRHNPTPIDYEFPSGVTAISAGGAHSLILLGNGDVYAFGRNNHGQLGHEDGDKLSPVKIEGLNDITAISAGGEHSLAVSASGDTYSFGWNEFGQLGLGHTDDIHDPTVINMGKNVTGISAGGEHSLLYMVDGVYSFGRGLYGRLGQGEDLDNKLTPEKITSGEIKNEAIAVSAGGEHSLVLLDDGKAYSFGRTIYGQLGRGMPVQTQIQLGNINSVDAGFAHTLVLLEEPRMVYSFGSGLNGRLGHGDAEDRLEPHFIAGLDPVKAVSAGGGHSLVLTEEGDIYSFGRGAYGRLGHGEEDTEDKLAPVKIEGLSDVTAVSAGGSHSLALTSEGKVYSFGRGEYGQLGHGSTENLFSPGEIEGITGAAAVSAGDDHSLILLNDGTVLSFGRGAQGRLGLGNNNDVNIPTPVGEIGPAAAVSAGGRHSLVLLEDGSIWSFGRNEEGQLGIGNRVNSNVPVKIEGFGEVKIISAGGSHSLVAMDNGDVYSFGHGEFRQLGHDNNYDQLTPQKVEQLESIKSVSAGSYHSVAATYSSEVELRSFNIIGATDVDINTIDSIINVTVPYYTDETRETRTDVTGLVAEFDLSFGTTATVNGMEQISGETENDFSTPLNYVFTSEDGKTQKVFNVTVEVAPNDEADIKSFNFLAEFNHELNEDFTGSIDEKNITVEVPYGTDLSDLTASFELSDGAVAEVDETPQVSGVTSNDFTLPVTYTVTAEDSTTEDWTVTVEYLPNHMAELESFKFLEGNNDALEDDVIGEFYPGRIIWLSVDFGTDLTGLVATFEYSDGAEVEVNGAPQVSGFTPNNFSSDVIYTVTSEDGEITEEWTIKVLEEDNTEAEIESFEFLAEDNQSALYQDVTGVIDEENETVTVTVPFETDVTGLVAAFRLSYGANAEVDDTSQVSGVTPNDFSDPLIYTVTSEDGDPDNTRTWTVTVEHAEPNDEAEIESFGFSAADNDSLEEDITGFVDSVEGTVSVIVPYGADPENLKANFNLSYGAEAEVEETPQISGVTSNDFSGDVIYTVTAQDGTTEKEWTVTVEHELTSFEFPADINDVLDEDADMVIDGVARTITATVPYNTPRGELVAAFNISDGADARVSGFEQVSGETGNDFRSPVTYTFTDKNGTERTWTVTVVFAPNHRADILTFEFPAHLNDVLYESVTGSIVYQDEDINVTVPHGTEITELIAAFTLSDGATAKIGDTEQESGETENDFTGDVTYVVTAENGEDTKEWTVRVTVQPPSSAAEILSFFFPASGNDDLDENVYGVKTDEGSYALEVPYGTVVSALVAAFEISDGAVARIGDVEQESGVTENNFSETLIYEVTAEDGTVKKWTITVKEEVLLSNETEILSYTFRAQDNDTLNETLNDTLYEIDDIDVYIDNVQKEITVTIPYHDEYHPEEGTGLNFVATYELSENAVAKVVEFEFDEEEEEWVETGEKGQVNSVTVNDFSTPVTYRIIAENRQDREDWTVKVEVLPNHRADFELYGFSAVDNFALDANVIGYRDKDAGTITLEVPFGTDISALIPTFNLSHFTQHVTVEGVPQVSRGNIHDFTEPVTYFVTAENGDVKEWTVFVEVLPDFAAVLSYGFLAEDNDALEEDVEGLINSEEGTISVSVPYDTDVTGLVAEFNLYSNAWAYINGIEQESRDIYNPVDFSEPVTYVVTGMYDSVREWVVTVTVEERGFIFGDVNEDGFVRVDDAILVLRNIVGLVDFDDRQKMIADVDGDGNVSVSDAILILRHIVGLITEFPVEKSS